MFVNNGSDYTIVVIGLTGAAFFFVFQLLLCYKAKKLLIKLIPICITVLLEVYCTATYFGAFGSYSAGAISGNKLVAFILAVVIGIACVGEALAWMVYGIYLAVKKNK